jgi:hypothetical protein
MAIHEVIMTGASAGGVETLSQLVQGRTAGAACGCLSRLSFSGGQSKHFA